MGSPDDNITTAPLGYSLDGSLLLSLLHLVDDLGCHYRIALVPRERPPAARGDRLAHVVTIARGWAVHCCGLLRRMLLT